MNSEDGFSITVSDLWKTFCFYRHPFHRFVFWATRGRRGTPETFHALRDVSFQSALGTSTGIIGVNGAGKSTLLKIITGTLEPTRGSVHLHGRVASLLELGTGFHPLFTGRQNIVYNARFLGLTSGEIQERLPAIEAFSELGDFLDRPLRTYSSGMQVRLAFAIAASVSPDILIIDEVLAVGDAYFAQKCISRIREFRDRGVTILFVSHDPGAVKTLCDRALLLHEGKIIDDATPAAVLEHYNGLVALKTAESAYFKLEARGRGSDLRRSGTFGALITDAELLDGEGRPTRALLTGAIATIRVQVAFFESVTDPTVGILIRDRLGNDVYGTNTYNQHVSTGQRHAGETLRVDFRCPLWLGPGEYSLSAAVHTLDVHVFHSYDWFDNVLIFGVLPADERRSIGVLHLRPEIETYVGPSEVPATAALASVVGQLPSAMQTATAGAELLREGWYTAEGTGTDAFRWTRQECVVLIFLRGAQLCLDAGVDRPSGAPPVELRVFTFGRELGCLQLEANAPWREVALPLPSDLPRGPTRVRLAASDAWRPADTGHGSDDRVLGVRIRRIWSD